MNSIDIKAQSDYVYMIKLIDNMLDKPDTKIGSVIVGKEYASKYKLFFENNLLGGKFLNVESLTSIHKQITIDVNFIITDNNRRIHSQNTIDNKNLILMIFDFIHTLYNTNTQ